MLDEYSKIISSREDEIVKRNYRKKQIDAAFKNAETTISDFGVSLNEFSDVLTRHLALLQTINKKTHIKK